MRRICAIETPRDLDLQGLAIVQLSKRTQFRSVAPFPLTGIDT